MSTASIVVGTGTKIVLLKLAAELAVLEPKVKPFHPESSARIRCLLRTLQCLNSPAHAWVLAEAERDEASR